MPARTYFDPVFLGTLALYSRSKLLLQNTLITDPQQIPNGLVCTSSVSGGARFRFKGGYTILGRRQGQSTTVQSSHLNHNGRYVCFDGRKEWPFYIYFNNGEYTSLGTQNISTVIRIGSIIYSNTDEMTLHKSGLPHGIDLHM